MIAVVQRVNEADVRVDEEIVGQIKAGMLVLLGVAATDTDEDVKYMSRKISQMRIFEDERGKMNLSAVDVSAEFLVVSQFTLLGDCVKGRRPSFDRAAAPEKGEEFYEKFVDRLKAMNFKVETGRFRAMMDVRLVNNGPVTFILESRRDRDRSLEIREIDSDR